MIKGIGVSEGIAIGKAFIINHHILEVRKRNVKDKDLERQRFINAVESAQKELRDVKQYSKHNLTDEELSIFEAHSLILDDPEFIGAIESKIVSEGINSEYALQETITLFVQIFEAMDNEYMRERAADVKDVGNRIMNILLEVNTSWISEIHEECIVIAKDLTPSDTVQMDKEKVLGFITAVGGKTSHTSIMARSLDIPAVVGVGKELDIIKNGDMVVVNGSIGEIIINPEEETINHYSSMKKQAVEYKRALSKLRDAETITMDGVRIHLGGNIGNSKDVEEVLKSGAQGIGLFRTEFLYMDSKSLPTEESQFVAYKEVLEKMKGQPVIIRTLDIGGDKKLPYLSLEQEMNPFLGYRALRICLKEPEIFETQLRALLRASIYGKLRIMFPMVSSVEEIREVKKILNSIKQEFKDEKIDYSEDIEIGVMIEIPSAALISDLLAKEVDFFSLGTNDLIQYTLAVDRINERVSYLYDPFHPSVLRLIKLTIDNAHKSGIWTGMCGEMAGDLRAIPILVGMGIDELSMSPSLILKVKKHIRDSNYVESKKIAEEVIKLPTSHDILNYLNGIKEEVII